MLDSWSEKVKTKADDKAEDIMVRANPSSSSYHLMTPAKNEVHASLAREQRADFGTLVIDGRGLVISCSDSGLRMFGGALCDLQGSPLWSLIIDITPSDTSPSYNARYINYLSKNPDWRRFQAVDVFGQCFPVDIVLSKIIIENDDMFLLNLRRPIE